MKLSEQNEHAWQILLNDIPNLLDDVHPALIRSVFDHAFYRGVIAEQESNQALEGRPRNDC